MAVALVSRQPFVLTVHSSVPAQSVPELIAWLRGAWRGGQLRRGRAGRGSTTWRPSCFACAPAGGLHHRVLPRRRRLGPGVWPRAGSISPFRQPDPADAAGPPGRKLRALAVTMAGGSTLLPGLPGLQEAGVPDYDNAAWTMELFVRPGTPAPAVAALRAAAARAVAGSRRARAPGGRRLRDLGPTPRAAAAEALLRTEDARGGRRSSRR